MSLPSFLQIRSGGRAEWRPYLHLVMRRSSGSALLFKCFDFNQPPGVHVENRAAHRDLFGNPGMRPDFLDLLPCIFLAIFIGEESHWSGRRIPGRSFNFAFISSPANVVKPTMLERPPRTFPRIRVKA